MGRSSSAPSSSSVTVADGSNNLNNNYGTVKNAESSDTARSGVGAVASAGGGLAGSSSSGGSSSSHSSNSTSTVIGTPAGVDWPARMGGSTPQPPTSVSLLAPTNTPTPTPSYGHTAATTTTSTTASTLANGGTLSTPAAAGAARTTPDAVTTQGGAPPALTPAGRHMLVGKTAIGPGRKLFSSGGGSGGGEGGEVAGSGADNNASAGESVAGGVALPPPSLSDKPASVGPSPASAGATAGAGGGVRVTTLTLSAPKPVPQPRSLQAPSPPPLLPLSKQVTLPSPLARVVSSPIQPAAGNTIHAAAAAAGATIHRLKLPAPAVVPAVVTSGHAVTTASSSASSGPSSSSTPVLLKLPSSGALGSSSTTAGGNSSNLLLRYPKLLSVPSLPGGRPAGTGAAGTARVPVAVRSQSMASSSLMGAPVLVRPSVSAHAGFQAQQQGVPYAQGQAQAQQQGMQYAQGYAQGQQQGMPYAQGQAQGQQQGMPYAQGQAQAQPFSQRRQPLISVPAGGFVSQPGASSGPMPSPGLPGRMALAPPGQGGQVSNENAMVVTAVGRVTSKGGAMDERARMSVAEGQEMVDRNVAGGGGGGRGGEEKEDAMAGVTAGGDSVLQVASGGEAGSRGELLWSAVLEAAEVALHEWKASHGEAERRLMALQSVMGKRSVEQVQEAHDSDQENCGGVEEKGDKVAEKDSQAGRGTLRKLWEEDESDGDYSPPAWPSILRKRRRILAYTSVKTAA